jgi:hypothetical protein
MPIGTCDGDQRLAHLMVERNDTSVVKRAISADVGEGRGRLRFSRGWACMKSHVGRRALSVLLIYVIHDHLRQPFRPEGNASGPVTCEEKMIREEKKRASI